MNSVPVNVTVDVLKRPVAGTVSAHGSVTDVVLKIPVLRKVYLLV